MPKIVQKSFIICTEDYVGLGWCKLLKDEGFDVILAYKMKDGEKDKYEYALNGTGLVKKYPIDDVMKKRNSLKNAYFIFDSNHLSEYSEKLRTEGFKVFGASQLSHDLEYERDYAVKVARDTGLDIPETITFTKKEEAIKFLESKPEEAFVFKPIESDDSWLTFVPSSEDDNSANRELQSYLKSLDFSGDFILQKRVSGVEVCVECYFYKGKPFFATCGLENKKELAGELGENVGCAMDLASIVPLDSGLVKKTIGKLFPFFEKEKYTGFGDVNVIIADRKFYFLEFCARFGYNFHPNVFQNLALDGFGDLMSDYMDGKLDGWNDRFRLGYGASVSFLIKHERPRLPIYIKEKAWDKFYPYDLVIENDSYYLSGYDHNIGIVLGHGYTIEDAWEDCYKHVEKINYPDKAYRIDGGKRNHKNSSTKRLEALQAQKLL